MATEIVELDGGRTLALERLGDPGGKPLLYFHGLPGSRLDLAHLSDVLAEAGVAVIAIDRPGFGGSTRVRGRRLLDWPADVTLVADRLGLDRFAVVGYSSGGKYALVCAYAIPERLTLTGLVASTPPPDAPDFRAGLDGIDRVSLTVARRAPPLAMAFWGLARRQALRRPDALVERFEKSASEPDRAVLADPEVRAAFARTLQEGLRPGAGGVVDDYAIEARDWGFWLEQVESPVIVWHGDRDTVVAPSHGLYQSDATTGAEFRVLRGAGHLVLGHVPEIATELAAGT